MFVLPLPLKLPHFAYFLRACLPATPEVLLHHPLLLAHQGSPAGGLGGSSGGCLIDLTMIGVASLLTQLN